MYGGVEMPETSIDLGIVEVQELFKKAKALRMNSQFEEAILCYNKILEINPKNINAMYERVHCYSALGYIGEIIRHAILVHQFEPNNAFLFLDKAHSLIYDDKFEEALEYFDKVVELWPTNSDIWCDRGIVLLKLDRIDEGLESIKQAILHFSEIDNFDSSYLYTYLAKKGIECLEIIIQNHSISEQSLIDAENAFKHIKNKKELERRWTEAYFGFHDGTMI
jgi:tetratricopeptide (TPR) repeat protein